MVDETPTYKIGLENVYVSIGTKESGTKQYRITFYLPGGKPVSLQFNESLFDSWKEKLSCFPVYDVHSYPYRYAISYHRRIVRRGFELDPYYNLKYAITEENIPFPLNDLLVQLKVLLSNDIFIAEMYYYVDEDGGIHR